MSSQYHDQLPAHRITTCTSEAPIEASRVYLASLAHHTDKYHASDTAEERCLQPVSFSNDLSSSTVAFGLFDYVLQ